MPDDKPASVPVQTVAPERSRAAGDTVTVACKLPNGLELHLDDMEDADEQVMGGGIKKVKRARQRPETYTVGGNARALDALRGMPGADLPDGGYALTPGIPRDFWERWLEANRNAPFVRNGLVFAASSDHEARARAADGVGVRTGLEPMRPVEVDREGRPVGTPDPRTRGMGLVSTADRT